MNEQQFKKLLIEMIRKDCHPEKNKIIDLLRLVSVTFNKTTQFARRGVWNQCEEYIYLSIIPDKLLELKEFEKYITKKCEEIYPISDEYALCGVIYKPGAMLETEDISQEIVFEDIRNQIIVEIRNAKYLIWIAMAWFTDPVLFNELKKKKQQGVTIEIVLDNNDKNKNAEFDIDKEFSPHWITIQSQYKNYMHEKFCIIDLQTVIHGTFNWTKAANFNKEHISIDRNRETAESFANEFIELKKLDLIYQTF